jgi:LPS-assembly lipoprotein
MWWREHSLAWGRLRRLAIVFAAASLMGGCFEPLYGARPSVDSQSVRDKFASVEIPAIDAPRGTPSARLASELRNSLQYAFNGGGGAVAPTHRLMVGVTTSTMTIIVDLTSGRPDAQVDAVTANYQLVEIATGKVVLSDGTTAHVDYDVPGSAQRFAAQRAQRDAEDRATGVVAEAIRNRVASYFVAGT